MLNDAREGILVPIAQWVLSIPVPTSSPEVFLESWGMWGRRMISSIEKRRSQDRVTTESCLCPSS